MKKLIRGGTLVNEGRIFKADILIENDRIARIAPEIPENECGQADITEAAGSYVIPGIIDDQVHFREPGLTRKGDIAEGSRAAAAGGITSFMDMPNVVPPTTTLRLLEEKQAIAARTSAVNYSFYLGATSDNLPEIRRADPRTTCGIKVFMGSSTGNMLVDRPETLERIFGESPLLIAAHCEDTPTIEQNLALYRKQYGDDIPAACHPLIRSREACCKSSSLAVSLARKYGSRLHILHISTAEETALTDTGNRKEKKITGEVCVHHLWFNDTAYAEKGNLVRWNPAIKTEADRQALLRAVRESRIDVIATDHAPHLLTEKTGPYTRTASGGPLVQHTLPLMLQLMDQGEIRLETIVDRMCHAPADLFRIRERGYLREGYKADICIFGKQSWQVGKENILYRCGWSPLEGQTFNYKILATFVNGRKIYDNGIFDDSCRGEMLEFN